MNIDTSKAFHFLGIGGSGMSPLAEIALRLGYSVSGTDTGNSAILNKLKLQNATIFSTHNPKNIEQAGTVIVSSAIKPNNPELVAAHKSGKPVIHRSDFLNFLMKGKKSITVAGTHGKTTTSSLITHMLYKLGLNPTAAIGGNLAEFDSSSLFGLGDYFVAEADESDGTFVKYESFISVLTNIDKDHLDYYKDFDHMLSMFKIYLLNTRPDGSCVIGWDNNNSMDISSAIDINRISYGQRIGSDIRLLNFKTCETGSVFECIFEKKIITVEIPLIGKHNILNTLCALSVAYVLQIDIQQAASTFKSFKGVSRRLEPKYISASVKIFDDYAHNPGKIFSCLNGVKEAYPNTLLHVIYQPHRYSRLETLYNDTIGAFTYADEVMLLPVYSAGEQENNAISYEKIASDITQKSKVKTFFIETFESCFETIISRANKNDIYLCVGAGDIWKLATRLGEFYAKKGEDS